MVSRHYAKWRREQGIPVRCDNDKCRFYTEPLIWNNEALLLILDHKEGNRLDNRPEKLRYLCPNCDSQLTTRGGLNKGRVEGVGEDRFTIITDEGNRKHELFHNESAGAADVVDAEVIEAASRK